MYLFGKTRLNLSVNLLHLLASRMGPERLELLLLLVLSWVACSFHQMPPLDATNLLPLDAANSPTLDGSLGSVALELDNQGPPPPAGGRPGSLGGNPEVEEEVPWVELSLKEEEVTDGGEVEGKVNVSEDASEEESDELTLEGEEEDEEEDEGSSSNGESEELESSEEEEEEDEEEEEEPSLRDLAKFPVKNPTNVLTKTYIVIIIVIIMMIIIIAIVTLTTIRCVSLTQTVSWFLQSKILITNAFSTCECQVTLIVKIISIIMMRITMRMIIVIILIVILIMIRMIAYICRCYPWEGDQVDSPFRTCKRRFEIHQ